MLTPPFRARGQSIEDANGRQAAVVVKTNCTIKEAQQMATRCAEWLNVQARDKTAKAAIPTIPAEGSKS